MRRLLAAGLLAGAMCPVVGAARPAFSPVVVTRDSLALKCSPRDVAELLLRFEDAFNAADEAALESLFARPGQRAPSFRRFTTDEAKILDRRRLVPFLLKLHAVGESMRLVDAAVANIAVLGSVSVGVSLLRVVIDPPESSHAGDMSSQLLHGEAAVDCRRHRIYAWNVGLGNAIVHCPQVPQANALRTVVACSRTGRRPLAQEVSRDFAVETTPLRLPRHCQPAAVSDRVTAALRAFDLAGAKAFARSFTRDAYMQPYTASQPVLNLRGRSQIAAFAARRTARGDGWTAARLVAPTGTVGLPAQSVYLLALRVSSRGGSGENGIKLVIDCSSGLIARWVGPALAEPQ